MSYKHKVLVIGGGGVGTIAAYALESGGRAQAAVMCRSNFAAVTENGFKIDSVDHGRNLPSFRPWQVVKAIPDEKFDYVLVTTKNIPDVPAGFEEHIGRALRPDNKSAIVLLQNGLNIEKPFMRRFPKTPILSGISMIGVTETSPGVVRHDGHDHAYIGAFPGQDVDPAFAQDRAQTFVDLYNASGKTRWEVDHDVPGSRWRKLVYNSSFNSVAAILGIDTGRMRMSGHIIEDLIRPIMLEIVAIAKAAGVNLPEDIHERYIRIDNPQAAFVPSMGQDASKGNFIEMENIVGEPLREADRLGVPAPTLRTIYGLLRGIQLKTKERKGLWEAKFEPDNQYEKPWMGVAREDASL